MSKMILEALEGKGSGFLPKPASIPYNGVNVEGFWQVVIPLKNDEEGQRREIILELQQEGELLRGFSIHTKRSAEIYGDPVRTYLQEGRIYNRFVQLNGKSPTPQRLLINSFLLEIIGDGRRMKGAVVAYSTVEGGIFTLPCECHQLPAKSK